MKTTRSNRPTGAPAYYLGRAAETWQAKLPRRDRPRNDAPTGDVTLRYYITGGSRWN